MAYITSNLPIYRCSVALHHLRGASFVTSTLKLNLCDFYQTALPVVTSCNDGTVAFPYFSHDSLAWMPDELSPAVWQRQANDSLEPVPKSHHQQSAWVEQDQMDTTSTCSSEVCLLPVLLKTLQHVSLWWNVTVMPVDLEVSELTALQVDWI